MITCTTPERIIPERTFRLYRFEELSAEAKAHALDEWTSSADYYLYNVSAEDESTLSDITEALEWAQKNLPIAMTWEIDAWGNVFVSFRNRWGETNIPDSSEIKPLPEPEMWAECDIQEPFNKACDQLRMDAYIYAFALESESRNNAFKSYRKTLVGLEYEINERLTEDIRADKDYHRSEEYFAEIATSCADLWFDAQGNQEDIPADAIVEER